MRIRQKIGTQAAIIHWMVEYAAEVINRFRTGTDGLTPRQRWNSSLRVEPLVAEFGESVFFMPMSAKDKMRQMEPKW